MTELFYNFENLEEYNKNNLHLVKNKLQFNKRVFEIKPRDGMHDFLYYSIINRNNKLQLYYRSVPIISQPNSYNLDQKTHYLESYDNGNSFRRKDNIDIILSEKHKHENVNHNFVGYFLNGKYIGLGGTEGIVFYDSEDGISWKENKDRYLKPDHPATYKKDCHGYDSLPSLIYFRGKYILYHRANLGDGIRNISYSESNNLKSWTPWKLINFVNKPFDLTKDSYYVSNIHNYNDSILYGIPPYCNTMDRNRALVLIYSKDGINWYKSHTILDPIKHILPVQHDLIREGDKYKVFTQLAWSGIDEYNIKIDRFVGFKITNRTSFITKNIELFTKTFINCKINKSGFLQIFVLNKNNQKINESEIINNCDNINYPIIWKNKIEKNMVCKLEFIGENCEIYAISGRFI